MKITVLTENSSGPNANLKPEFGLSLFIETGKTTVLMDTGASDRFAANADALGVDLEAVDWLVLSHGHYDHGGGLETFFQRNRRAQAIIRRGADKPLYGTLMPGLPDFLHRAKLLTRYIGLDTAVLGRFRERIRWADADIDLTPNVRVLTTIPRIHALAQGNRFLLIQRDGRFIPDDFKHELLLVIEQNGEAVVFSGCAHNGVQNMIAAARSHKPQRPIRSLVGGFHLTLPRSERMSAPEQEIRSLARDLGQQVIGDIYTGHCTGTEAFQVMKSELGSRLNALHTGIQFEV
jgi:7,8-dihydropterin-6-yl-methyl-4-(beta-D-ribofuranosyl)aminobenzene 5'-phosphate synthase